MVRGYDLERGDDAGESLEGEEALDWKTALEIEGELVARGFRVQAHHDIEGFAWVSGTDRENKPFRIESHEAWRRWEQQEEQGWHGS